MFRDASVCRCATSLITSYGVLKNANSNEEKNMTNFFIAINFIQHQWSFPGATGLWHPIDVTALPPCGHALNYSNRKKRSTVVHAKSKSRKRKRKKHQISKNNKNHFVCGYIYNMFFLPFFLIQTLSISFYDPVVTWSFTLSYF